MFYSKSSKRERGVTQNPARERDELLKIQQEREFCRVGVIEVDLRASGKGACVEWCMQEGELGIFLHVTGVLIVLLAVGYHLIQHTDSAVKKQD